MPAGHSGVWLKLWQCSACISLQKKRSSCKALAGLGHRCLPLSVHLVNPKQALPNPLFQGRQQHNFPGDAQQGSLGRAGSAPQSPDQVLLLFRAVFLSPPAPKAASRSEPVWPYNAMSFASTRRRAPFSLAPRSTWQVLLHSYLWLKPSSLTTSCATRRALSRTY